jgi:hypothetical protein
MYKLSWIYAVSCTWKSKFYVKYCSKKYICALHRQEIPRQAPLSKAYLREKLAQKTSRAYPCPHQAPLYKAYLRDKQAQETIRPYPWGRPRRTVLYTVVAYQKNKYLAQGMVADQTVKMRSGNNRLSPPFIRSTCVLPVRVFIPNF